jgi:hypothetical protein
MLCPLRRAALAQRLGPPRLFAAAFRRSNLQRFSVLASVASGTNKRGLPSPCRILPHRGFASRVEVLDKATLQEMIADPAGEYCIVDVR